jgi:hypothetical protein
MFPRKALIEYPPAKLTADCLGMVDADDGGSYYIKGDVPGRSVRASEWLGTHIAEAVGIQAPAPVAIELNSGSIVFGSRRIAGVADDVLTRTYLMTPSASNLAMPIAGLATLLSKIYALDLFLHNEDRHFGNYLSIDDNGVRRLYAFDFSRAVFWQWPWNGYPAATTNTRTHGKVLRQLHGFDSVAAGSVLDNIRALAPATIESFINQMPSDWSSIGLRAQFVDVWSTGHCTTRVDALRKGLSDGTLL